MKDPLPFLIRKVLQKNEIKIDHEELEFQLMSHPTYPSLHAITGVLNHFGIQNLALEIPRTQESLDTLPPFFLAHVKSQLGKQLALVAKKGTGYELTLEPNKKEPLSPGQFMEVWTGIIIAVEKEGADNMHIGNKLGLKASPLFLLLIPALFAPFFFASGIFQSIHFALSGIGLFLSVLIVQHELGMSSSTLNLFCSPDRQAHNKTSCGAVLNSSGATVFKLLKLSDMGIIYFVSLVVVWYLTALTGSNYKPIGNLSLLAIPFTFYSLYYQYKTVKKWCPLCLGVVLVLWFQAATLLIHDMPYPLPSLDVQANLLMAFTLLLVTSVWQFILPKIKKEQEYKSLKVAHTKFKRNFDLFKVLIAKTEAYDTVIEECKEIVFGNRSGSAPLSIMVITNPLCGHCREVHGLVRGLLKQYGDLLQICIRFNIGHQQPKHASVKIAARLLELHHSSSEPQSFQALHDAFEKLDPDQWLTKWGAGSDPKLVETLKKEQQWCQGVGINFTPAILINGWPFPREYERSDLSYFIDDMLEDENFVRKISSPDTVLFTS